MKKNLDTTDRLIRFIIFDFAIGFPLTRGEFPDWLAALYTIVTILLLITVIIGI